MLGELAGGLDEALALERMTKSMPSPHTPQPKHL
jgi:hypothetical protein